MEATALPYSARHSLVGMLRIDSRGCVMEMRELPPNSTAFGINLNPNTDAMENEDWTKDNFRGGEGMGDSPNRLFDLDSSTPFFDSQAHSTTTDIRLFMYGFIFGRESASTRKPSPPHSSIDNFLASLYLLVYLSHSSGSGNLSDSAYGTILSDHKMLFHALEACKLSFNLRTAVEIHSRIIKLGYGTHSSLVSLLISVYVSCDHLDLACQLLNEFPCWDFDLVSANMIITSFMKVGEIDIAQRVFHKMHTQDVVSWNSMIGGYVRNACFQEALDMFRNMFNSNIEPDGFTFASIVTGCAQLGALDYAKWVHNLMFEKRVELNYILRSALIDMYSKCGRIEIAKAIFNSDRHTDVSVWNAMINGLAIHGLAFDAIAIFLMMEVENILPDSITFMGILTACSHCGLVEQGHKYFNLMKMHFSVEPQLEHYGAMVDLLGRAGLLEEAYAMIKEIPMEPDVVIWRAFLNACRIHKNSKLAEVAIAKISHLGSGDYVLLSNIYCSIRKWESAERVRDMMKKKGVRKKDGRSWIELRGAIHQFKAGDRSHPEIEGIYKLLAGLICRAKMVGFVPMTELVLMDTSEEEKEENLIYHSEKLALAYGILKSSPGTEIQVSKNLRICPDCHCWMKIVSKVLYRVIIVRDRVRFHRFEGGLCTCGDYW
ncbi:unnamed protein product [Ilex paraguariensis]|uniref:DYW domain-containing protein n=1 Tax=Ilex paraguariensis TaxID=185542 RepID=A0ABC8U7N7_9AQUA